MEEPCKRLDEHMKADERMFENIHSTLTNLRDNHIAHLTQDVSSMKTDVSWLKESNSKQQTLMYGILSGLVLLCIGLVVNFFK